MECHTIFVGIFFCLLNVSRICAIHMKIYIEFNLEGESWTCTGTRCCTLHENNKPTRPQLGSLSTDTCMIIYTYASCKGYWSKKYFPSSHNFPKKWYIASMRPCNDEEGGPQLHVDIMYYFPIYTVESPATLQRYRNVCSCFNVPDFVQRLAKWSINNHNNEMMVYSESNCLETTTSKARRIPAGLDVESTEMSQYSRAKSFGPDPNSVYFKMNCLPQSLTIQQQQSQQLEDMSSKNAAQDTKLQQQSKLLRDLSSKNAAQDTKLQQQSQQLRDLSSKNAAQDTKLQQQSQQLIDLSSKLASYDKKLHNLKHEQEDNLERRFEQLNISKIIY